MGTVFDLDILILEGKIQIKQNNGFKSVTSTDLYNDTLVHWLEWGNRNSDDDAVNLQIIC